MRGIRKTTTEDTTREYNHQYYLEHRDEILVKRRAAWKDNPKLKVVSREASRAARRRRAGGQVKSHVRSRLPITLDVLNVLKEDETYTLLFLSRVLHRSKNQIWRWVKARIIPEPIARVRSTGRPAYRFSSKQIRAIVEAYVETDFTEAYSLKQTGFPELVKAKLNSQQN